MVQRYQKRISGPRLDRIDIHLAVARVPFQKLSALGAGEPLALIRQRAEAARAIQAARFADVHKANILVNSDMGQPKCSAFVC